MNTSDKVDIAQVGEDVLLQPSMVVEDPSSDRIKRLAQAMKATLVSIDAIAMAAPQLRAADRVFVFHLPTHRIPSGARTAPVPWTVAVNPVVEPLTDRKQLLWERCLSVPLLFGRVPRPARIRLQYQDLDGADHEMLASGFLANVLQHEQDHLDGVLYMSRLQNPLDLAAERVLCGNSRFYPYTSSEFDGPAGD